MLIHIGAGLLALLISQHRILPVSIIAFRPQTIVNCDGIRAW